jgi:hypothetical protein
MQHIPELLAATTNAKPTIHIQYISSIDDGMA